MTTSYTEKVRRIRSTSLIAYWPLDENSGTVAWDWGKSAYNATSSGVVPADKVVYGKDGGPCYKFDGSASYVDIYAALAGAIDTVGTGSIWFACEDNVLNGTTLRRIFTMSADANNAVLIEKTAVANTFRVAYIAGGTTKSVSPVIYEPGLSDMGKNWHHLAITLSTTADEAKVYLDGAQSGSTLTSLGTWSGAVASDLFVLGSASTTAANVWLGWLQHMALWSVVLSADEIADLAKIGP